MDDKHNARNEILLKGLARYHVRAPRYILSPQDDTLIRLAGPKQTPWEEGTQILNFSETGLSFTAPSDLCPQVGEVIKIQFTPPDSDSVASFAITTRVIPTSKDTNTVGVRFYRMDVRHRVLLSQIISRKLTGSETQTLPLSATLLNPRLFGYLYMVALATLWLSFVISYFHFGSTALLEKIGSLF